MSALKLKESEAKEVIETMFHEQSLRKALKIHGVSPGCFFRLLEALPELDALYCRTQAAIGEQIAEEIIAISDEYGDPQRAKNRIDARKWYASKVKPKKFGDRIDVNITETVDIKLALTDARNRIRPVSDLKNAIDVQPTVLLEESIPQSTGYESVAVETEGIKSADAIEKSTPEDQE